MPAVILVLLIAMFSLSLWAAPPSACEVLAQTRLGRLLHLVSVTGAITPEELEAIIAMDEPTNPFAQSERSVDNIFFRQRIDVELLKEYSRNRWPEMKAALIRLLHSLRKEEASVETAREQTKFIFSPKPHTTWHKNLEFQFNPVAQQIITWNHKDTATTVYTSSLKKIEEDFVDVDINAAILVRANGEVWTAGFNKVNEKIVVRRLRDKKVHVELPAPTDKRTTPLGNMQLSFFETPDGRMLLVNSTRISGIFIYDVTTEGTPRTLLQDAKESHRLHSTIHISRSGQVYVMGVAAQNTIVYRLKEKGFEEVGRIVHPMDYMERVAIMTTDAEDTVYIGQPDVKNGGYRIDKLVNGLPDEVLYRPDLNCIPTSAVFHWSAKGKLLLGLSRPWGTPRLDVINVFERNVPDIQMSMDEITRVPPSWFKLPNGQEVVAVAPRAGRPMVFALEDGGSLWALNAESEWKSSPAWMQTPDGKIFLAVGTESGLKIFSAWHFEPKVGAK